MIVCVRMEVHAITSLVGVSARKDSLAKFVRVYVTRQQMCSTVPKGALVRMGALVTISREYVFAPQDGKGQFVTKCVPLVTLVRDVSPSALVRMELYVIP